MFFLLSGLVGLRESGVVILFFGGLVCRRVSVGITSYISFFLVLFFGGYGFFNFELLDTGYGVGSFEVVEFKVRDLGVSLIIRVVIYFRGGFF